MSLLSGEWRTPTGRPARRRSRLRPHAPPASLKRRTLPSNEAIGRLAVGRDRQVVGVGRQRGLEDRLAAGAEYAARACPRRRRPAARRRRPGQVVGCRRRGRRAAFEGARGEVEEVDGSGPLRHCCQPAPPMRPSGEMVAPYRRPVSSSADRHAQRARAAFDAPDERGLVVGSGDGEAACGVDGQPAQPGRWAVEVEHQRRGVWPMPPAAAPRPSPRPPASPATVGAPASQTHSISVHAGTSPGRTTRSPCACDPSGRPSFSGRGPHSWETRTLPQRRPCAP